MTGTKTNERPGTRAQVRYLRMSASKARVVLDLIRDKHVGEAIQILSFSERLAAEHILKLLNSAVANAEHNDDIPAEELYVSACYADEGPTLKRFRPRARGRAGRIAKRTCHITVIVSRLSDEQLDQLRTKAESRGGSTDAAAARRRRVAKSKADAEAKAAAEAESADDAVVTDEAVTEDALVSSTDTPEAETTEAEAVVTDEAVTEDALVGDDPDTEPVKKADADDTAEGDA